MIDKIKNLRAELDIEVLGDPRDVVVLERRKIHVDQARAGEDIAPCVATQIKTWISGQIGELWIVKGWVSG